MEEVAVRAAREAHPGLPNQSAFEIGLRLDQILNGMNSVLAKVERQDEEGRLVRDMLERLRERLDKMERAREVWEKQQDEIRQMSVDKSESVDPELRAQAQAKAARTVQDLTAAIRSNATLERARFIEQCKNGPKVPITATGKLVFASGPQGTIIPTLQPEVIGINGLTWVLQPNRVTQVPQVVADRYMEMKQEQNLLAERKRLLGATTKGKLREEDKLAEDWSKLNAESGSPTEPFPIAGGT